MITHTHTHVLVRTRLFWTLIRNTCISLNKMKKKKHKKLYVHPLLRCKRRYWTSRILRTFITTLLFMQVAANSAYDYFIAFKWQVAIAVWSLKKNSFINIYKTSNDNIILVLTIICIQPNVSNNTSPLIFNVKQAQWLFKRYKIR